MKNTMKAVDKLGLAGDVERVELFVKKGIAFDDENMVINGGYLFNLATGKTVALEGFKNVFIMVIEL